jgi:hypothetical protein
MTMHHCISSTFHDQEQDVIGPLSFLLTVTYFQTLNQTQLKETVLFLRVIKIYIGYHERKL